ncbi:hypothetical protein [Actinacidiphila glaucinigra]|uniref:hypothetical protein n=1 Tax=Actinacidiphila glaucinigra TaxID=235986 RepID=UPI003715D027
MAHRRQATESGSKETSQPADQILPPSTCSTSKTSHHRRTHYKSTRRPPQPDLKCGILLHDLARARAIAQHLEALHAVGILATLVCNAVPLRGRPHPRYRSQNLPTWRHHPSSAARMWRMVAIIRCTETEARHIEFKETMFPPARREEWDWTIPRPQEHWSRGRHLSLIATPDASGMLWVTRLGLAKREKMASDLQQKLRILHTTKIQAVLLKELLDRLQPRHQRHLVNEGQQTEATGKALLEALLALCPEAVHIIEHINATIDGFRIRPESRAEQVLAVQRDATLALPRMAGMSIPQLARWDPPAEQLYDDQPPPAYVGMLGGPTHPTDDPTSAAFEDHLINRDTENLLGWIGDQTSHVA